MAKYTFFLLVIAVLFLGGCVQVDVNQRLYRNGHFDLEFVIESSKLLEGVELGDIPVDPILREHMEIVEEEKRVRIVFKDVDPSAYDQFVADEKREETKEEENTKRESEQVREHTSWLDSENIHFDHRFRFPYYVFTYTVHVRDEPLTQGGLAGLGHLFIGSFVDMDFTLEVFGKITDTNGELLSDDTVHWNVMDPSLTDVYVEFRDPFWKVWWAQIAS